MADTATLQARLAEAETALHRLRTGTHAEKVSDGETTTEFTPARIPALQAYIADLLRRIGQGQRPGPIRTRF